VSKKKGLGRGLDALLQSVNRTVPTTPEVGHQGEIVEALPSIDVTTPVAVRAEGELRHLPIEYLQRGRYQPRREFPQESLEELAASIKAQGVMQPIVVRPITANKYEIIAGERRWRATQLAGLDTIPCVVKDVADDAAIAMALIENIQREDLNPMEEAMALQRLLEEFELTHQQVADAVGKSRATVTNLLRLTSLTPEVKTMVERGDLEMGHARALLSLGATQQTEAARSVVQKGLSVRQTEEMVRRLLADKKPDKTDTKLDPNVKKLMEELSERVGAPVQIQHGAGGKGKLVIQYNSLDELDGILAHIK